MPPPRPPVGLGCVLFRHEILDRPARGRGLCTMLTSTTRGSMEAVQTIARSSFGRRGKQRNCCWSMVCFGGLGRWKRSPK